MIRQHTRLFAPALLAATLAVPALAQDQKMPQMTPEQLAEMQAYIAAGTPGTAHAALAKTAGNYDLTMKSWSQAGAEPMVEKGTATRSMSLGGRMLVEDVQATMMGQPYSGRATMGYDNTSEKYWSTWNDSMSTGMMVSEGTCDAAGTCSFTGSWMNPVKKVRTNGRMASRWTDANTQLFELHGPGRDGKDMKMMEITYVRKP